MKFSPGIGRLYNFRWQEGHGIRTEPPPSRGAPEVMRVITCTHPEPKKGYQVPVDGSCWKCGGHGFVTRPFGSNEDKKGNAYLILRVKGNKVGVFAMRLGKMVAPPMSLDDAIKLAERLNK